MGVQGLWRILESSTQSVELQTLNQKRLAIDASIWIHQFLKAIKDSRGKVMGNAHILGFLRRICKLLFFNIKPVFIFDGKPPELKKRTIRKRKQNKDKSSKEINKTAERILMKQIQNAALESVGNNKHNPFQKKTTSFEKYKLSKRNRDEFELPVLEDGFSSTMKKEDPRYDFDAELIEYLKEFNPLMQDIGYNELDALPDKQKYDIINELRFRSRQTSLKRLNYMKQNSDKAINFSQLQIQNLVKRNELTQKYLDVVGIGDERHLPNSKTARVAAEKGRAFTLVKNNDGGWKMESNKQEYGLNKENNVKQISTNKEQVKEEVYFDDDWDSFDEDEELDQNEFEDFDDTLAFVPGIINNENNLVSEDTGAANNQQQQEEEFEEDEFEEVKIEIKQEEQIVSVKELNIFLNYMKDNIDPDIPEATIFHKMVIYNWDLEQLNNKLSYFINLQQDANHPNFDQLVVYEEFLKEVIKFKEMNDKLEEELKFNQGENENKDLVVEKLMKLNELLKDDEKSVEDIKDLENNNSDFEPISTVSFKVDKALNLDKNNKISHIQTIESNTLTKDNIEVINSEIEVDSNIEGMLLNEDTTLIEEIKSEPLDLNVIDNEEVLNDKDMGLEISTNNSTLGEIKIDALNPSESLTEENDTTLNSISTNIQIKNNEDLNQSNSLIDISFTDESSMNMSNNTDFFTNILEKGSEIVHSNLEKEIESLSKRKIQLENYNTEISENVYEDIKQLLNLFGIPYLESPEEAEAQCAELLKLGLVDGIVTDDSDVFLFGGSNIYRYLFSNKKNVEYYNLEAIENQLNLSRDRLIQLAFLLGSDYTQGLENVGPITAIEILAAFPNGLSEFIDWWNRNKFLLKPDKSDSIEIKKLFKLSKKIQLPEDFLDPLVIDAYYNPNVDDSNQEFQWGKINLDALKVFLAQHLGWDTKKTEEVLLPVIDSMNKLEKIIQPKISDYFSKVNNSIPTNNTNQNDQSKSQRLLKALEALKCADNKFKGKNSDKD